MKIYDKLRIKNLLSLIILGIIIIPVTSLALNSITTGWKINATATTIDAFGTCKKVSKSSGANIFVPTKTSAEWSAFRSHLPSGTTLSACPPPCGGLLQGGYCWYKGADNKSCTQACASHGGCNLAGTQNYVGSGGTFANCVAVTSALGMNTNVPQYDGGPANGFADGCNYYRKLSGSQQLGQKLFRSTSPATTCEYTYTGPWGKANRICACNN